MIEIVRVDAALKKPAAAFYAQAFGLDEKLYLESIEESLQKQTAIPSWYVALNEERQVVAGCGIIANDFHTRLEWTPNICCVYTDPAYRHQRLAKALMDRCCAKLHQQGIEDVWLLTDHKGLYERYDFQFAGYAADEEGKLSRGYHRKTGGYQIEKGRWRHFKGGRYEVLTMARHSETEQQLVVYRPLDHDSGIWVRPACMWQEVVERDGKLFCRFEKEEEE